MNEQPDLPEAVMERNFPRLRRTRPFHPERFAASEPSFSAGESVPGVPVFGHPTRPNSKFLQAMQSDKDFGDVRVVSEKWATMGSSLAKLDVDIFVMSTSEDLAMESKSGMSSLANSARPKSNAKIIATTRETWKPKDNALRKPASRNDIREPTWMFPPRKESPVDPLKICANCSKNINSRVCFFYCSDQCHEEHWSNFQPSKEDRDAVPAGELDEQPPEDHVPIVTVVPTRKLTAAERACANCSKHKPTPELYKCARRLSTFSRDQECQNVHCKVHESEYAVAIQSPKPRAPELVAHSQVEKFEEVASRMLIWGGRAGVFQNPWTMKPKGPRPSPPTRVRSREGDGRLVFERRSY
ncbi:hypothetical protein FKW77_007877 [Venturia effusa]|uniref:Uncharacterized protein n=1 Tax=Venturia effusa TaxID=50376 RepID=A0A517L9M4_9PEZI|nr:hypothetical protein FKW77_007877 [Venturia effusa]